MKLNRQNIKQFSNELFLMLELLREGKFGTKALYEKYHLTNNLSITVKYSKEDFLNGEILVMVEKKVETLFSKYNMFNKKQKNKVGFFTLKIHTDMNSIVVQLKNLFYKNTLNENGKRFSLGINQVYISNKKGLNNLFNISLLEKFFYHLDSNFFGKDIIFDFQNTNFVEGGDVKFNFKSIYGFNALKRKKNEMQKSFNRFKNEKNISNAYELLLDSYNVVLFTFKKYV